MGYDVDDRNSERRHNSLMHIIAEKNLFDLLDLLLPFRPDIDSRDRLMMTPLFYAAKNDNFEMFKRLIELGADVNAVDRKGVTVVYFVIAAASLKYLKVLVENGARLTLPENKNKGESTPQKKYILIKAVHMC